MSEVNTSPEIQLLAGLAITDSEKQILQDIKTIQRIIESEKAEYRRSCGGDREADLQPFSGRAFTANNCRCAGKSALYKRQGCEMAS